MEEGAKMNVIEAENLSIRQMNREFHTTIFLTSHDIGDIEKLCRRVIIVNSGQIVLDDSMEHLGYFIFVFINLWGYLYAEPGTRIAGYTKEQMIW